MDSNYHWQKQQANERVQARMREAEVHRMLKGTSPRREFTLIRFWKWIFSGVASTGQDRKRIAREDRQAKQAREPRLAN